MVVAKDEERNAECWLARESERQLKVSGTDVVIEEGEPVHDRGSSFVARAVRFVLAEESGTRGQSEEIEMLVKKILGTLRGTSEISKATHPCVYAWRCKVGNDIRTGKFIFLNFIPDVVLTTCATGGDDDSESRASVHIQRMLAGRNVENVLVVLTRYWNGVLLGPDRFE